MKIKLQKIYGQYHGVKGFTLLELAVVIMIIGLLTAGTLAIVLPLITQAQNRATEANMSRVVNVISAFAQRNHRIPCPAAPNETATAQPYGSEIGSGTNGNQPGSCAAGGATEGIVPFRTLGLRPGDVRDGYGRFLTYAVSPVFARDTTQSLDAHKRCRIDNVWVFSDTSRNAPKARFCCPDLDTSPATDLVVRDEHGNSLWLPTRDSSNSSYEAADIAWNGPPTFDLADDSITTIAFVLISHGPNGFGAFLPSGARLDSGGVPISAAENENRNGNNIFIAAPRNRDFDDILMWRTQDQLYAETGAASCAFP